MRKIKHNIGHIIGSIAAVLVLVDFALVMLLACVMLVRLILKVLGL
jgi:hypothetical protein